MFNFEIFSEELPVASVSNMIEEKKNHNSKVFCKSACEYFLVSNLPSYSQSSIVHLKTAMEELNVAVDLIDEALAIVGSTRKDVLGQ